MSKEKKIFVAENQYKEDFLRIIDIVSGVFPIIKELGIIEKNDIENKNKAEMLSQDIKNLEATKKVILDQSIVKHLENIIEEKTNTVVEYVSKRAKVSDTIIELKEEVEEYEKYAIKQYSFFESMNVLDCIDFSKMTYQQIFACIFIGVNVSEYIGTTRIEVVERQRIAELCNMNKDQIIERFKEIL